VFFLVQVGRGTAEGALSAEDHEDVCHLLWDASHHGSSCARWRRRSSAAWSPSAAPACRAVQSPVRAAGTETDGAAGRRCGTPSRTRLPPATARESSSSPTTARCTPRVSCAGLGTVREQRWPTSTATIRRCWRSGRRVRPGRCGACEHRDLCGGSPARAWAATGRRAGRGPACALHAGARLGPLTGTGGSGARAAGLGPRPRAAARSSAT